jgi:hypothetical protein
MGEGRGMYRVLVGKPRVKRPLGRPRHRWEDNIEMDLQEVKFEGMDWIDVTQDRDICECGKELLGSTKYGEFID